MRKSVVAFFIGMLFAGAVFVAGPVAAEPSQTFRVVTAHSQCTRNGNTTVRLYVHNDSGSVKYFNYDFESFGTGKDFTSGNGAGSVPAHDVTPIYVRIVSGGHVRINVWQGTNTYKYPVSADVTRSALLCQ